MARAVTAVRAWRTATTPLLLGLGVQAVTTYLFLVLAGQTLGPVDFGALSGLYLLLTGTATGLFAPLEQEITRRLGRERVGRVWDATLLRRALGLGLATSALAAAVFVMGWRITVDLLGGHASLIAALVIALPGYACWFAVRGELAGRGRVRRYGAQLALDGVIRLLGGAFLAATGSATVEGFGLLFATSPWLTLALTWTRFAARPGTTHERGPGLRRPVALLVLSALAAQLVINAGPVMINVLASPAERAAAGVYLAALVVLRVPVFLFSAVQPSFLPALAERAARGQRQQFERLLGKVLLVVLAVTALVSVCASLVGPRVVSWLFDFDEELSRAVYLLLTVSVGLFLAATILAQGLLALGRHRKVAAGWVSALLGLVIGSLLPGDAVDKANYSLITAAAVATTVLGLLLWRELSRWPDEHGDLEVRPPAMVVDPDGGRHTPGAV